MISKISIGIAIALSILTPISAKAVTIANNNTARHLVNTLLGANSGLTIIGTPTYTGSSLAAGIFTGGNNGSSLGIDSGIVLSTGKVSDAPGANNGSGGTVFNLPGDPDLTRLAGYPSQDAAVLTFKFTSSSDNLFLSNYIFASQEYPNYVGTAYNDLFGYFLDG